MISKQNLLQSKKANSLLSLMAWRRWKYFALLCIVHIQPYIKVFLIVLLCFAFDKVM